MDYLKPELWTTSSNSALNIFITDSESAISFSPTFTYPIFGDSESIFGFQNLSILLCFDHYTMFPFLNVKYDKKLNDDVEDPKSTMLKYLPEYTVFKDEEKWVDSIGLEKKSYTIPGTNEGSFTGTDGFVYKVYKIQLGTNPGQDLLKRLQIFVLLFIEAGSYIDGEDELWDLYVVYKNEKNKEDSLVGFCTAYNYWKYPGHENFDNGVVTIRKKISQFIVLPNHRGKSIGTQFYNHLYKLWLQDDKIVEIVVEDPNESFDDMRDKGDLARISSEIDTKTIDLAKIGSDWAPKLKQNQKLETRQFNRLLEMILLKNYRQFKQENYRRIRLFIKKRLYEKNKDALMTLEKPMRMDKLQTAYEGIEEDYYRILGDVGREELEEPGVKRQKLSV